MINLENKYLKITINSKGAELQRLLSKETNIDYLWNGDENFWGKHSPVLFPVVGALKNDEYLYQGKTYHLSRHGFARDMVFEAEKVNEKLAVFTLIYNAETLKKYPFKFKLILKYELLERKLNLTYRVVNLGTEDLYFSLGAHPAFAVPNTPDTQYEDYYLAFNDDAKLEYWNLDQGLVEDHYKTLNLDGHKLNLRHPLFYDDALVLKTLQSSCISLLNTKNDHGLHFHFEHFPYFGIWAAKDAPFVCLEPWCGIADSVYHDQNFTTKEGVVKLVANSSWERFWEVECF